MKNNPGFKSILFLLGAIILFFRPHVVLAVETAPRITDREIVEKLSRIEEGQKSIDKRFEDINKRFEDINKRFEDVNKRFEDVNKRFEDVNKRIDDLRSEMNGKLADLRSEMNNRFNDLNQRFSVLEWMIGAFITIALAIFTAMGKILWDLSRRQAAHEKVILNLSGEIESLKQTDLRLMDQIRALIEALKPPRGVL